MAIGDATTAVEDYKTSIDLSAWLSLNEVASNLPAQYVARSRSLLGLEPPLGWCKPGQPNYRPNSPYSKAVEYVPPCPYAKLQIPDQHRVSGYRDEPLRAKEWFPQIDYVDVMLYRRNGGSIFIPKSELSTHLADSTARIEFFDIVTKPSRTAFEKYMVVHTAGDDEKYRVAPREDFIHTTKKGEETQIWWDSIVERPIGWERASLLLATNGVNADWQNVSLHDKDVLKLLAATNISIRTMSLLGLSIRYDLALFVFGVILLVVAIQLWGTLNVLATSSSEHLSSSWMLVYPRQEGAVATLFELLLVVFSIGFTVLPLVALRYQFASGIFDVVPKRFESINIVGALAATMACGRFAGYAWSFRKRISVRWREAA